MGDSLIQICRCCSKGAFSASCVAGTVAPGSHVELNEWKRAAKLRI